MLKKQRSTIKLEKESKDIWGHKDMSLKSSHGSMTSTSGMRPEIRDDHEGKQRQYEIQA